MKSLKEHLNESLLVESELNIDADLDAPLNTDTDYTFKNSKFNRDISKWTASDVKGMNLTFKV